MSHGTWQNEDHRNQLQYIKYTVIDIDIDINTSQNRQEDITKLTSNLNSRTDDTSNKRSDSIRLV